MSKQQRINITISKSLNGKMNIDLAFHPKISQTKEQFEALPMDRREMINMAARIGTFVMKSLAAEEEKENAGTKPQS